MKTLLLMRHAKSDWSGDEADFDRPLNARGRDAATRMAGRLHGRRIDQVICSPSVRTRQTLDVLMPGHRATFDKRVYEATPEGLFALVAAGDDGWQTMMILGHMPAIAAAAEMLAGGDIGPEIQRMMEGFPTAALAELELDVLSWGDVAPGCGRVTAFTVPRDVP